jgi:hypothetical protein
MLDYFTANTVSETVCFVIALVCLYKDQSLIWRSMILFLMISCLADYFGKYLNMHGHNNLWVYNIFMLFEAGFTNLMFLHLLNKYNSGRAIVIVGLAMFVVLYGSEIIQHGIFKYNNLAYTVMSIIFVLNCMYYYYLLMKDEKYINPLRSPEYWWIAGSLVFYFSNMVLNIFYDQLNELMILPRHHLSYFIIKALNIILYSCWSFSFICRRWLTTTSGN